MIGYVPDNEDIRRQIERDLEEREEYDEWKRRGEEFEGDFWNSWTDDDDFIDDLEDLYL